MVIPILNKKIKTDNLSEIKDIITDMINKSYKESNEPVYFDEPLIFYNTVKYLNHFDSIVIPEHSIWLSEELIQKTLYKHFIFFGWTDLKLYFNYTNKFQDINKFEYIIPGTVIQQNYIIITGYSLC